MTIEIQENESVTAFTMRKIRAEIVRNELGRIKDRIDNILNNVLCNMKPGWDDSIVGFNEAWNLVRDIIREEIDRAS